MEELDKLETYLREHDYHIQRDAEQIIVYDEKGKYLWDAICNVWSYGHKDGLLEIMGYPVVKKTDRDSVVGWLTADDVIERIESDEEPRARRKVR